MVNRYIFIGSVDYSARSLRALLEMELNIVAIMCPHGHVCRFNSDYRDLGALALEYGKSVHYFEHINQEAEFIKTCRPDVIFILGLSQMVPKEILSIPTIGCIGSHPALLPKNRGRHPIIWSIANGLAKSGITLFWLDEDIDSGDIWYQKEFDIGSDDDASTVYEKVSDLTIECLRRKIPELEKGIQTRMPQDHSKANYLRRRTHIDGRIDWASSSSQIHNLVRALTRPYPGAHCVYKNREVKIWRTNIIKMDERLTDVEPGNVIKAEDGRIVVKTGDGLIELVDHEFRFTPELETRLCERT